MSRALARYFDQELERLNLKIAEDTALGLNASVLAATAAVAELGKQRESAENDD